MAPLLTRKRNSDESPGFAGEKTPMKKRKVDLTVAQKQALIDNLQLEITERARRLRAQYNVQAQQLRSRVEMRVNRIPRALRSAKMGDLMAKHSESQKTRRSPRTRNGYEDKENSVEPTVMPKKKVRGATAATTAEVPHNMPGQILSPADTNARVLPRGAERAASPAKSMIARPASPSKAMGTASRSKKPAATSASATGSTRGRRKISQTSESSEASTGTVVKKTAAASRGGTTTAKNPPAVKRSVMNTLKSATTKKAAPAAKSTTGTSTAGRTLRKRQAA